MTELAERAKHSTTPCALGPQSLVWRYFGDNRMFLIGPRPAVLQNMLAELGQGVLDHSVFFDDTAARVKRSLPPIFMTVYGSDDDNDGTQVRDFHTNIKGEMPDGARYHALDPETYFWAHATFVEQVLYFADTFVKRLTDDEKEQIYLESKTWYRRYGVSDRPMPADYAEFERYWDRMIDEIVVAHPTAKYGVGYVTKGFPRPKAVPQCAVAADRPGLQPRRGVPDHRRHAAARPRSARAAVERPPRAPIPAVRRAVAVAAGELAVGSSANAPALQHVRSDRLCQGLTPPQKPSSTPPSSSSSSMGSAGLRSTTSRGARGSAGPPSTGASEQGRADRRRHRTRERGAVRRHRRTS